MISARARAAAVFENEKWEAAAIRAAEFVLTKLRHEDGRLLHTWRNGAASIDGYLDDYASMLCATLELYRLTFDCRWLEEAASLADQILEHFGDDNGGFFFTAGDAEQLIARKKPWHDNSVPSGNALAACGLLELGLLIGNEQYVTEANKTIAGAAEVLNRVPHAAAQMLIAYRRSLAPRREIVLAGDVELIGPIAKQLRKKWLPDVSLIVVTESETAKKGPLKEILAVKEFDSESATLFECENHVCQLPVVGVDQVAARIREIDQRDQS